MDDAERKELEELKTKCLKKDGTPRKDADTGELQRLMQLTEQAEAELDSEQESATPLTAEEQATMERLEDQIKASKGRQIGFPTAYEMALLGRLRRRAGIVK